jgi:N6-adenosine-specific RNA methylase IME4/transcriptional antiterminator Rof (Rho-off)
MQNLSINPELKALIPPLTSEEFAQLEANVCQEGIREPIITWQGTIVDGHNRYELAQMYDLPFKVKEMAFASMEDCKEWMIRNQFGRRNLSNYQRSVLALELESVFKAKAKENQIRKPESVLQKSVEQKSIDTQKELAKVANVSHDTIAKVKVIEAKAPEEVKAKLSTGEVSINQVYQDIKKEEKKAELEKKKEEYSERITTKSNNDFKVDIFNTNEKFRVIYADPAWSYNDKQDTPQLGGAAKHYQTMSVEQICQLPVKQIAEKDSVLFLWVTSPLLEDSFRVINEWGFKYKTSFIWDKVKHNMGHYNSVRHEILLIATKGSCVPDNKRLYDSVQAIERNDNHSEKPIEFLNIIDDLYNYGNKLEMFCRNIKKSNWYGWGNEL